jgi:hypothetical protein
VLGGVRGAAIDNGHGAIEVRLDPIVKVGHGDSVAARCGRARRRKRAPAR